MSNERRLKRLERKVEPERGPDFPLDKPVSDWTDEQLIAFIAQDPTFAALLRSMDDERLEALAAGDFSVLTDEEFAILQGEENDESISTSATD